MITAAISPIDQRRIEAKIVKLIYDEMSVKLGQQIAEDILLSAITKESLSEGEKYAKEADGKTTPEKYLKLMQDWSTDGSLNIEQIFTSPDKVEFKVTHCKYAEMYQEMGITELGYILSCGRDGAVCSGYNPDINLKRSQTIMQGASFCDFKLKLEKLNGS